MAHDKPTSFHAHAQLGQLSTIVALLCILNQTHLQWTDLHATPCAHGQEYEHPLLKQDTCPQPLVLCL